VGVVVSGSLVLQLSLFVPWSMQLIAAGCLLHSLLLLHRLPYSPLLGFGVVLSLSSVFPQVA
jgi:hypothetical protein